MKQTTLHGIRFEVDAVSEQGPRPENQDAYLIDDFESSGVLAVADGMGGEKSGRTAADTALEALRANSPIRSIDDARRAVREADRLVLRTAEAEPERLGGMGSALGLLALIGADAAGWIVAHVGDVRILSRSPDGVLRLETRDHTPAFARWEAGEITMDEIPDTAGANRLQRAIGRGGEADVSWMPAAPGWSWMIISDGVYKAMRLDELAAALAGPSAAEACDAIRRKVEERGPDDNFTAVVVRALADGAAPIPPNAGTDPMISDRARQPATRSAGAAIALALAVLALVLAGAAFWAARDTSESAALGARVDSLRVEVDSMRTLIGEVIDPFAPSAPAVGPGLAPETVTSPGAQPAGQPNAQPLPPR